MILDDGTLKFELRGGEKIIAGSVDLLVLELACNELVQTHGLPIREDGRYQTTAEFALALATRLTVLCRFDQPHELTPTQAHALWVQSGEMMAGVKKNTPSQPTSPGITPASTLSDQATPTVAADSPTGPQTQVLAASDLPGCC